MSRTKQILGSDYEKIPQRIEWKTVLRILSFLRYNGRSKKTHISMTCNLGYKRCVQYLNWLTLMDLIKMDTDKDDSYFISMNERGTELVLKSQN